MDQNELYRTAMGEIIRTARLNKQVLDSCFQRFGLHHSQHKMMMFLYDRSTPLSQREIARELNISPAATAVTVKKMVQKGYFEKKIDRSDERCHLVSLSEQGKRAAKESEQLFFEINRHIFDGLEEDALLQLCDQLRRLQKNLTGKKEQE